MSRNKATVHSTTEAPNHPPRFDNDDTIQSSSSSMATQSDTSLLLDTVHYAAVAHQNQKRKSPGQAPYIQHPIDVARRIAGAGSSLAGNAPIHVLQAALLHDVIEDCDLTAQDVEERFGPVVTKIVLECSDDKSLNKQQRKQAQIDHAPHKSREAAHVKLADKLSNLTDLTRPGGMPIGWTVHRVQEYFVWAKKVTDAIDSAANPGLSAQLHQLYKEASFEHKGKRYKAHPEWPQGTDLWEQPL
ncbi:hypothetical protein OIV83_000592 [Microbotryomycetes sp. JL201]|nr:hypothetical protein OIV83_000592 [Microbotryomycetes sp. JL201]